MSNSNRRNTRARLHNEEDAFHITHEKETDASSPSTLTRTLCSLGIKKIHCKVIHKSLLFPTDTNLPIPLSEKNLNFIRRAIFVTAMQEGNKAKKTVPVPDDASDVEAPPLRLKEP